MVEKKLIVQPLTLQSLRPKQRILAKMKQTFSGIMEESLKKHLYVLLVFFKCISLRAPRALREGFYHENLTAARGAQRV